MSDYVKATNFTAKDSLPSGNSGKIVKGSEIDTEFNAIASAISSKTDSNSPTLTGTPVAPTASAGTNTTQIATTAFVSTAITNERTATTTLTNKTLTSPTINGGAITGITDLAVADGGTGVSTIAANAVVLGNGTSAIQTVAPGASGNLLTSNGTTWQSSLPPAVGVTSVATGNGLSGGTITSTGTLTIAAPGFNTVGSYALGTYLTGDLNVTLSANTNVTGGTGNNQFTVGGATVSGTWRLMSGGSNTSQGSEGGNIAPLLAVRIS